MVFWEGYISNEMMGMIAPIAMYWVYGGAYQLLFLLQLSSSERFRLHTREEEEEKNLLQLPAVAKGVLLQQLFQAIVVHLLFFLTFESSPTKEVPQPPILVRLVQFFVVMYATDAWQYFIHRYMHENKFLYCRIRSRHHLLIIPYAVGALYNHPLEELFVDTLGGSHIFPRVGDDAEDGCVLLLLNDQNRRRALQHAAARKSFPHFLREQFSLP